MGGDDINRRDHHDVNDVREDYISKALASKGKYKENRIKRVFRIVAVVLFIILLAVILLPILFAILLWIASFFV